MEFQQRLANSLRDQPADISLAMKSYFALGRMDIYVHRRGINFKKETADGIASLHQGCVIALQQREIETAIFNWTTIDEQVLV